MDQQFEQKILATPYILSLNAINQKINPIIKRDLLWESIFGLENRFLANVTEEELTKIANQDFLIFGLYTHCQMKISFLRKKNKAETNAFISMGSIKGKLALSASDYRNTNCNYQLLSKEEKEIIKPEDQMCLCLSYSFSIKTLENLLKNFSFKEDNGNFFSGIGHSYYLLVNEQKAKEVSDYLV